MKWRFKAFIYLLHKESFDKRICSMAEIKSMFSLKPGKGVVRKLFPRISLLFLLAMIRIHRHGLLQHGAMFHGCM